MDSPYRVKIVPCESGERFPFIVTREGGMPLFSPCVYLTTMIRSGGSQDATLEAHARAIKFLYDWSFKNHFVLERRFKDADLLKLHEIDNLVEEAYCRSNALLSDMTSDLGETTIIRRSKVAKLDSYRKPKKKAVKPTVSSAVAGTRLSYIRSYLDWLATRALNNLDMKSKEYGVLSAARTELSRYINAKIPSPLEASDLQMKMGMTKETEQRMLEVIDPKSPENPWRDTRVRVRNQLFIYLLLLLGIRRGEALGLRVEDINFEKNTLTVHRTPDDETDPRLHQPQTKTKARELPLTPHLALMCREYIIKFRSLRVPGARRHHFLFVNTTDGAPIAKGTADDIFGRLRVKVPELPKDITPHIMRHTWNDRFSEKADENIRQGIWTEEAERTARSEKMGWTHSSQMAMRYSRRHIIRQANEASLALQESIVGRNGGDDGRQ